ncbi:metallophosphoesterase family protein [Noviherbaspirillum massiliense]|uniref:metallophosphoesterase family protein n=1 Tax=Noviherbaspirillum massiliense TaxID=1465823 RepID=UPI0002FD54ED|nr:DNA repair exonuclease [Noviherbaspirillum massiliense]
MVHFLHTADWQIGTRFGQFGPEEAALLAEARFEAVENIARLASQLGVQAVLVAGDVFDQQTVTDRVVRRLFASLAGFRGHWIMIPGNHDAALPESVWTRALRLNCIPGNVKLLLAPQLLSFDEGFSILAAPLTQRRTFDDVTEFFDRAVTAEGHVRIGLSHGSVLERLPEGIDGGNPIAAERAQRASLDYLALGDWHGLYQINERTWYSGTPETDRFRENRSGMVLEVKIEEPRALPQVSEHRIGRYDWQRWDETLAVASDVEMLTARLADLGTRDVVQLTVRGALDLAASSRLEAAIADAQARARALRADLTGIRLMPTPQDLAELGAQGGYLANVVERLRALQDDAARGKTAAEALLLLSRIHRDLGNKP